MSMGEGDMCVFIFLPASAIACSKVFSFQSCLSRKYSFGMKAAGAGLLCMNRVKYKVTIGITTRTVVSSNS